MNVNSNVSSIGVQLIQSGSGTSQAIPQASDSADLGSESSTSGDAQSPAIHQSPPPAGMGQIVDKTV